LDPASGEVRYRHVLKDEHVGYTKPPDNAPELVERIRQNWPDFKTAAASDKSDSFSMHGALPDIMSAENGSVFMRHLRFDDKLNPMDGRYPRLFSTSSLLDGYEFNRSYWILGTADFKRIPVAYSWLVKGGSLAVPYGLMLSFDASTVRGVRREKASGSHDVYSIFSVSRPDPKAATSALPDFEKRAGKETADQHAWKTPLPFRPRSMITCGRTLVTGGMARQGKGILRLTSARTGATLRDISIPASPVWDGMGSAGGSLVVPLTDGSVVCLGTP
jgi:hypothetical protein